MHSDPDALTVPTGFRSSSQSPSGSLSPGQKWGKFLIERTLGEGGQAQVLQAFDQVGTAGHVALKVPTNQVPPEQAQAWIETEAGALVKLEHPNIVRVLDAGLILVLPYVATPLVEGLTMREHVQANPPPPRQILDWMIQLTDAFHYAHSRGIVHRDVKPRNVMITTDGKPMLIDFGVASLSTAYDPEARHDISGTFPFMAPEQVRGDADADHRVDVFGLGGILKFLLVGEGPYDGQESLADAVRNGRVTFIEEDGGPALLRALRRIANRALEPDPTKRYRSAKEMGRALRIVRAKRLVLVAAAAAAVAVAATLALQSMQDPPEQTPVGGVAAALVPKAIEAELQIHLQRKEEEDSYRVLTADDLPLRNGDKVQIHGELSKPLWAYVIGVSSEGEASVLYPEDGMTPGPVDEIHIPSARNYWLTIEPPGGTETIMLLAHNQQLADPEDYAEELLAFGRGAPSVGGGMLVIDGSGPPRMLETGVVRGLSKTPVKSNKGFLDLLQEGVPHKWDVVRVVAFPHGTDD